MLRLPGTLNHNGADGPVEVRILENRFDLHYAVDDFEQFLPAEESVDETTHDVVEELVLNADAEPPALKLLDVASTSPAFWETWNRQRGDLADSSQSGYDLSLATITALGGWTDQEIANLIIAHRRRHGEKPEKALRGDYVRRTIGKARRAAMENASAGEGVDLSALLGRPGTDGASLSVTFGPHAVVKFVDCVEREQLEWLWPGRIPLGKLTLLCGDPGLGKSFLTLDMASRVSTGTAWPDMPLLSQPAGKVVLLNAEDDLADTIAPRLDRAGADDSKIIAIEGVELHDPEKKKNHCRSFTLEEDLPRLEEVLADYPDIRLVVIDPISAYCGKVDSHRNSDVRGLLAPLADLASRRRVAILAVTHLAKSGGSKAVYRAMGSLAFAAAARAVWTVVKDTDDPQRRLFLPAKMNLAGDPDGLAYRITEGRVAWEPGSVRMHADDAFAAEAAAAERKPRGTERKEAAQWLREQLAGGFLSSKDLIEEGHEIGFSAITLRRAYKEIGGKARKSKFDGGWVWELPNQGVCQDDQIPLSL